MLICCREMSLTGSTSFGFAQNTMYDFQNTLYPIGIDFDKMLQKQMRQTYIGHLSIEWQITCKYTTS